MQSVFRDVQYLSIIPAFVKAVKEGKITAAADIIAESSALPAICGRVCPQETQCEGKCIRGIKGDPISIGKAGAFRWLITLESMAMFRRSQRPTNGKKVAIIGSGPQVLTCAGDLAKLGYELLSSRHFTSQAVYNIWYSGVSSSEG